MAEELDTTRARQGQKMGRVRYILAISLSLTALAFLLVYLFFFSGGRGWTIQNHPKDAALAQVERAA